MFPCQACGTVLVLEYVKSNPFKVCPTCGAALDKEAANHKFVEPSNASDPKDAQRVAHRAQLHRDVDAHQKSAATRPATFGARVGGPGTPTNPKYASRTTKGF